MVQVFTKWGLPITLEEVHRFVGNQCAIQPDDILYWPEWGEDEQRVSCYKDLFTFFFELFDITVQAARGLTRQQWRKMVLKKVKQFGHPDKFGPNPTEDVKDQCRAVGLAIQICDGYISNYITDANEEYRLLFTRLTDDEPHTRLTNDEPHTRLTDDELDISLTDDDEPEIVWI